MNEIINIVENNYSIKVNDVIELFGGWLNKKYLISNRENKYVLKILSNEKFEKMNKEKLPLYYYFIRTNISLEVENYMYEHGINCPRIISNLENKLLTSSDCSVSFFIMDYIDGISYNSKNIEKNNLFLLGQETGKLHNKFDEIKNIDYLDKGLKLPKLDDLIENNNRKLNDLNLGTDIYKKLLLKERENLDLIKSSDLFSKIPIGIIHGDYANDNIIFKDSKPYVIDFELIRENSYLQDVGRVLLSFCYENDNIDFDKLNSFVKGYNNFRKLELKDILLSFIVVWLNEFNLWTKKTYFEKEITAKSKRFQEELVYITDNFNWLVDYYYSDYADQKIIRKLGK
jgi:Ser/Thr protein kinase RdoA (MazF antagonist)